MLNEAGFNGYPVRTDLLKLGAEDPSIGSNQRIEKSPSVIPKPPHLFNRPLSWP